MSADSDEAPMSSYFPLLSSSGVIRLGWRLQADDINGSSCRAAAADAARHDISR